MEIVIKLERCEYCGNIAEHEFFVNGKYLDPIDTMCINCREKIKGKISREENNFRNIINRFSTL